MTASIHHKVINLISLFTVPILTLLDPKLFHLYGIGPSWAILFLLAWAIKYGRFSGAIIGLCLGLMVDEINSTAITQIPVLLILGWWWGNMGKRSLKIENIFNIGLMSWIGTIILGLSIWLQTILKYQEQELDSLLQWGWNNLLSQSIVTALVAPVIIIWLTKIWSRR